MGKVKRKDESSNTCSKADEEAISTNQKAVEQKTGKKKHHQKSGKGDDNNDIHRTKKIKKKSSSKKQPSTASKKAPNVAKLPSAKNEYSANWKQLLKTIEKPAKKKASSGRPPFPKTLPAKRDTTKVAAKLEEEVKPPKAKPEIWFDDVDPDLLDPADLPGAGSKEEEGAAATKAEMDASGNTSSVLVKEQSFQGLTRAVGIDCEMVGVGYKGEESVLARVSIVNHFGHCVYDKYVKPREKVTDYRTRVSGIRPADVANGEDFQVVQKEVSDIFEGRILVGHSIKNDLKVLFLTHPKKMIRDTSLYRPFRALFGGKTPSLKRLTARLLGVTVQEGEHSSVQDAQATIRLYTMYKRDWEKELTAMKYSKAAALASAELSNLRNRGYSNKHRSPSSVLGQQQQPLQQLNNQRTSSTSQPPPPLRAAALGNKPEYVDSD